MATDCMLFGASKVKRASSVEATIIHFNIWLMPKILSSCNICFYTFQFLHFKAFVATIIADVHITCKMPPDFQLPVPLTRLVIDRNPDRRQAAPQLSALSVYVCGVLCPVLELGVCVSIEAGLSGLYVQRAGTHSPRACS